MQELESNLKLILPFFLLFVVIEMIWSYRNNKESYNLKETLSNFVILIGGRISRGLLGGWLIFSLTYIYQFSIIKLPDHPLTYISAIIFVDLLYYWEHRFLHQIKFFWAFHEVHHSSPWFNLTTSFRLNWLSPIISPIFFIPAVLIGFSPKHILVFFFINLLYQFWLHTETIGKLGFIEKILNTPSSHRVHHGSNDKYIDKNFGGIFIIWDRLFKTYQEEIEKVNYGITTGFKGHNPLVAVFSGFIKYFRNTFETERKLIIRNNLN